MQRRCRLELLERLVRCYLSCTILVVVEEEIGMVELISEQLNFTGIVGSQKIVLGGGEVVTEEYNVRLDRGDEFVVEAKLASSVFRPVTHIPIFVVRQLGGLLVVTRRRGGLYKILFFTQSIRCVAVDMLMDMRHAITCYTRPFLV